MIWLHALVAPAWPCAGFVHEEGALAETDAQQALVELTEDGSAIEYKVVYEGDAEDFGWIIPVPGVVSEVSVVEQDRFDQLAEATAPEVYVSYDEGTGTSESIGCACGSAKGGDLAAGGDDADTGGARGNSVEVVAEGYAGEYAYAIVEATDASDFQVWLDANGWTLGETSEDVAAYVQDGGFQWVTLELRPTIGQTDEGGRELPVVRIEHDGPLLFPSRMAHHASAEELHTVVYVVGDQAGTIAGWGSEDVGNLYDEPDQDPTWVYENALRELGADTAYGRVYAGTWDDGWITRFETIASRDLHTVDATFALDGGEDGTETIIDLYWASEGGAWPALVPVFGLLVALVPLRRR